MKRKFEETIYLKTLNSESAENLIKALLKSARSHQALTLSCFDLIAPEYLLDTFSEEDAKFMIAYGPGARFTEGKTNVKSISIFEAREEEIASVMVPENIEDPVERRKAAIQIKWPSESKSSRDRDRSNYNNQAASLFGIAESMMSDEVRLQLNSDITYRRAKQKRCVITFLETIRQRSANGFSDKQLNREHLEKRLNEISMGEDLSDYHTYKKDYIQTANNLRSCVEEDKWVESIYINKFLAGLDQDLFRDIYFYRIQDLVEHRIRNANSIQESVEVTDKIFNFATNARNETKRAKKAISTEPEESVNIMTANVPKKDKKSTNQKGICKFYVKGDESSCKKGDKCTFKHNN